MAYSYVGTSNLEFHQGDKFFEQYLSNHPAIKIPTSNPEIGTFLINTNDFLDIWNFHRFDWLSKLKPSGQVAYNGLLITVSDNDIKGLPDKQK
jgi:hypothetical protein